MNNKLLSLIASFALCTVSIEAAGTAVGTDITNTATLSFSVGGVSQTDVVSNIDTFKVDKKIDFILTHEDTPKHLIIVAAKQDSERNFNLLNESNDVQDFTVAVSNLSGDTYDSKGDSAEMQNLEISVNGGAWVAGPITIPNVAVDATITIKVRGDVLADAIDGEVMNVQLEATAVKSGTTTAETNTAGADNKTAVDTVLGEGAGISDFANVQFDGKYFAWSGYLINTANVELKKLSCVWKDEVIDGVNSKRIPGATIVYVFDLKNNSTSTDATGISLSDTMSNNYNLAGTVASAKAITNVAIGTPCSCTNGDETGGNGGTALGADAALAGQVLTLSNLSVAKDSHTCVSMQAVINLEQLIL